MKRSIRSSVFETNSSSVHSCSITTEQNYKDFNSGKVWYNEGEDKYLPEKDAIEFNLNYIKDSNEFTNEEFKKFTDVYKKEKNFYDAFEAINVEFNKWDIDPYDVYLNSDDYWDYNQYEDWWKGFNDSNGTPMVAWGYCGHD